MSSPSIDLEKLRVALRRMSRGNMPDGRLARDRDRAEGEAPGSRGRHDHADKFWAVALACQKERTTTGPRTGEIGVRVLG